MLLYYKLEFIFLRVGIAAVDTVRVIDPKDLSFFFKLFCKWKD